MMEKVKVVFRKAKNPYTEKYEVIAFYPEIEVSYGNILSYTHIGGHSEASLDFYHSTKKVTPEEYKPLLVEIKGIYDDCELVVRQKINYKDLYKARRI